MRNVRSVIAGVVVLLVAACGAAPNADDQPTTQPTTAHANDQDTNTLTLTAAMVRNLGIETTPAQAITYTPGVTGFGVIVAHDAIAQLAADLETANAVAKQSQTALERAKGLAGGPGALGSDTLESAAKQTAADQAALTLARRKLTAVLGRKFPQESLAALADGTYKLARVTFPLNAGAQTAWQLLATGWAATTSAVWDAPQDPTIPGRTFYALLKSDIPEGTRVQAAPMANGTQGVLVPSSAIVASDGQYWCYVRKDNTFTRVAVDINRPLTQGYFMTADRIATGDAIVTAAAGLLLARQTNSSSAEPD